MKLEIQIKPLEGYNFTKVRYYTLVIEGEEKGEVIKFFDKYKLTHATSVNYIRSWLMRIGEKYGALDRYFRPEDNIKALPPNQKEIRQVDISLENDSLTLRLYCIVLSRRAVILVNGGVKESQATQDSPSCWEQYLFTSNIGSQIYRQKTKGLISLQGKTIVTKPSFRLTYNS